MKFFVYIFLSTTRHNVNYVDAKIPPPAKNYYSFSK